MFVYFGSRETEIKKEKIKNGICPHCKKSGQLTITLFAGYGHLFHIPFLPTGKRGIAHCEGCDNVIDEKHMADDLKTELNRMKGESKRPLWHYVGILIIAIAAAGWFAYDKMDNQNDLKYLESPEVGDIYEFVTDTGNYSHFKVDQVLEDKLILLENSYEMDQKNKEAMKQIGTDYFDEKVEYTREQIKGLFNEGIIFNVRKPGELE